MVIATLYVWLWQYLPEFTLVSFLHFGAGGIVSIWAYSVLFINAVSAFHYRYWIFPKLEATTPRKKAKYVFAVSTMYEMLEEDLQKTVHSFGKEILDYKAKTFFYLLASKEKRAKKEKLLFEEIFQKVTGEYYQGLKYIPDGHIIPQDGSGKRVAMSKAMAEYIIADIVANGITAEELDDSVLLLMDGDSILLSGTFDEVFHYVLDKQKNIWATTWDNRVFAPGQTMKWVLSVLTRFTKRPFFLSASTTVLTGRGAALRASVLLDPEFIMLLGRDHIDYLGPLQIIQNWLHSIFSFIPFSPSQRIEMKTGDDKSTMHYILSKGGEVIFIPTVYCLCIERIPEYKIENKYSKEENTYRKIVNALGGGIVRVMLRLSQNMMRGAYRELSQPVVNIGWMRKLVYFDQLYGFWRPLFIFGTMSGLYSVYGLVILAGFAYYLLFSRIFGIIIKESIRGGYSYTFFEGVIWWMSLPMRAMFLVIEQYTLPIIKIYGWLNIDISTWNRVSDDSEMSVSRETRILRSVLTIALTILIICLGYETGITIQQFF
jgi:hypothetical protein